MSNWRIPLSDLDYGPEEHAAIERVLRSKWLSMGPEVQAFEKEFATMQGARHALAVANATIGLQLSLLSLGVGPGDEVIQPAINFVAAANMTVALGATPVFADIVSLDQPTIDPDDVRRLVTPRTKAVVAMHYGGNLCRMADLAEVARARGLALVEDACHAVGVASSEPAGPHPAGTMAGSIGDVGAFSFFSNKNLATGEGGMVVTDRDDLAERLRLLRSHGMTTLTWDRHRGHASSYQVVANGYNGRMDELHAALGRAQLAKLARNNERRRRLLSVYAQEFASLDGWAVPFSEHVERSAGHLMVVVAPSSTARVRVAQGLRDARIQTSLHYPCVNDFEAFVRWRTDGVARSREFAARAISLPIFPAMSEAQVREVCDAVRAAAAREERT